MKIICSNCKKVLGEQKPFKDLSEIKAKCPDCLNKEKERLKNVKTFIPPSKGQEITFENGWKGILSVAGEGTEELSFWDLIIAGRKFFCSSDTKKDLKEYLGTIKDNEIDVTFIHSASLKIDKSDGRRKRKEIEPKKEEKSKDVNYNCTIRVPKEYVEPMFDDKIERLKEFIEILVESERKRHEKECQDINLQTPTH